ncbi:CobW family GTP-binding protein [Metabacillus malikii]|uniref:G3E family GTPase n=1 Tax=Metabacillus malikii TaxID=1504265 RepID=A0ABT9ZKV6_9BACI|nr:GTP-binding protein [Metabacillus malikii]MDQ0232143.1 G3E family GTPase [Metabacillus malikii]
MGHTIDVYIISGFLGSGKTTVLKKLVEASRQQGKQVGVILNELGDTNVEQHLFALEKTVELLNGCICCSMQDDLKETLHQFIEHQVDVLFIEGTGVANPNEIVEAIVSPEMIDHYSIQSIISLVDASQYLDYQSVFSSSKEIRTLLKEQITCASLIILNKVDLVADRKMKKVVASIEKQATGVPILNSTFGNVEVEELLKARVQTLDVNSSKCTCGSGDTCSHHHHATLKAVKFTEVPVFSKKEFEKWLKQLPKEVLRGKGIVKFDETDALYSFQYASGHLQIEEISSSQAPIIILIGDRLELTSLKDKYEETFLHKLS